ncbi:SRPBCC family protein [Gemmatimonas phototrophica]|uniref:ATPase n=1 Tax=Gemmatimonas phototrophica TaxID=1379270 RepID=A0A143BHN7_9BACT|nr:SRPBCC family protein [Gemmatimonas phototrophica]AMW03924.1 ATPase [Gemmatimonas phototrophica]
MPITEVVSNAEALTLSIVADYPVPLARLWDAYADPRKLERFWGPREWPATFTRHDMAVGGYSHYHMTGPDGTISRGWFRFLTITPHQLIEVEDGFADEHGQPNTDLPGMRMTFMFEATETGSRFRSVTYFNSVEEMEKLVEMGMMEGMRSAMSQIDDVLTDLATFAATLATHAQLLNDTQVRVSRVVRGTPAQLWRAHHEPALMQRWLTGPDGWTMPVCQVAKSVGERYRYEWASNDGAQRFGFEGELLESMAPHRAVTSEQMIGTDGPATRNEMTLTPVEGGTLLSILITYPSKELRDMILGTGMTTGMEASYARLEQELLAA